MDHLCYLFLVFLLLFHVVSWVRCGTLLYRFPIFDVFLTMCLIFFLRLFIAVLWSPADDTIAYLMIRSHEDADLL